MWLHRSNYLQWNSSGPSGFVQRGETWASTM
jgi:hypothetical protein